MKRRATVSLICSVLLLIAAPSFARGRDATGEKASPRVGSVITVAAAGDIARRDSPGAPQKQTASLITNRIHPQVVLALGDEQYEHGELTQFMRSYDPTWGAFKSITAPVPGNHEYETSGASGYFAYFKTQLSARQASASDPHQGYYSFDQGGWHFVALNSNCRVANCSAQATWLKNDLASDGSQCEIVYYHDPGTSTFTRAAAAGHAEFVLSGHLHRYERWNNFKGYHIRQFIVGTGGRSSGDPDPRADAEARAYGVLQLDLGASSYSWQFIDVAGRVRDSGNAACAA